MKVNPLLHKGIRVLVLGYGVSGRAALRYLKAQGATVYVSDAGDLTRLEEQERANLLRDCADYEDGGHSLKFLDSVDMVFVSPGVAHNVPLILEARRRGLPMLGELALAAPVLEGTVAAVTGTNGKTTVTTLIGDLFSAEGRDVFVGGNIGTPVLDALLLPRAPEVLVLELSSFQLERAGSFRPDIAVLLNVTPDHLDRHGSFSGYLQAKAKIFANQKEDDVAILCGDDLSCRQLIDSLQAKVLLFGQDADCDAQVTEDGVEIETGRGREKYPLQGACGTRIGRLNSAAAILAAGVGGCSSSNITAGLASFKSLPHRMEFVADIDGVTYWDDSKGTNTGAVISALGQARGPVFLIAGGREKGEDYALLREMVAKKVRRVVLIGEAAPAIARCLRDLVPVEFAATMETAVHMAAEKAKRGDVVLLSPACASFDMFTSYKDRGNAFRAAVEGLRPAAVAM